MSALRASSKARSVGLCAASALFLTVSEAKLLSCEHLHCILGIGRLSSAALIDVDMDAGMSIEGNAFGLITLKQMDSKHVIPCTGIAFGVDAAMLLYRWCTLLEMC